MKDNERLCLGCFKLHPRSEMFRILKKHGTSEVILAPSNKDFGRSVYICKNKECLESALKKGKINKFLKGPVPSSLRECLEKELN